ncbi:MAG TPA: sugar phosphate isomerase/epimerase [Candidatus Aquilonibacter sp.]|nr:sugar phosphate isomerase/epimerase [Candidatus Aquilonibacter sp.]
MLKPDGNEKTRRSFLKEISAYGGGIALVEGIHFSAAPVMGAQEAAAKPGLPKQIGLGLYTVRDLMTDAATYQSTLAKVAEIGYKEVEPADRTDSKVAYAGLEPKAFRALLDQLGLSMPSTHSSAIDGPGLENQLEGFQVMGIKYTEVIQPSSPHASGAAPATPAAAGRGRGGAPPPPPSRTMDAVKRIVDDINQHAQITKKFGIKMLVRMDIDVFVPLSDQPNLMPYQVIADNTDPSLVTMQIDIGWAAICGQDIVGMFKRNPGHYELWHVKDTVGLRNLTPEMSLSDRRRASYFVPVGLGQVDLQTIFANAELAGLKHIGIEQDNAGSWGDSLAAARVNYNNVMKLVS